MAMNHFVFGAAILVLGIVTECSAQHWRQNGYSYNRRTYPQYVYPNYQQQRPYQPQNGYENNQGFQLPPGISVSDAEWVCKNPKTGDMMIIATEDGPAPNPGSNNGQGQWQQPTYPQVNPTQPIYPQVNPNQPTYPQVDPNYPTQPTQKPQQPTQAPPNMNGDGLIDIRFGEK